MKKPRINILITIFVLAMSSLACSIFTTASAREPKLPVQATTAIPTIAATKPVTQEPTAMPDLAIDSSLTPVPGQDINGDGKIDICEVIPQAVLESTIGRPLHGAGQLFSDPAMGNGCAYDFGSDNNAAYFAYVTIGTEANINDALANAVNAEPVTTIGDSAFLNYGPDARQLWVRVGQRSVLVAIGDRENIPAAMIFAQYMVDYAVSLDSNNGG